MEKNYKEPLYTAFNVYADEKMCFDINGLYEEDYLNYVKQNSHDMHIYFILKTPKIELNIVPTTKCDGLINFKGTTFEFKEIGDFSPPEVFKIISSHNRIDAEVLYIGQAYGAGGKRTAVDRLLNHSTLQKILAKEKRDDCSIMVCMFSLSEHRNVHVITPCGTNDRLLELFNKSQDNLNHIGEKEKISLFEGAMIKKFMPKYNLQLKDSFPSDKLKMLSDCYDKEIHSVSAEICFDDFEFNLFTDDCKESDVKGTSYIIAQYMLKEDLEDVFMEF